MKELVLLLMIIQSVVVFISIFSQGVNDLNFGGKCTITFLAVAPLFVISVIVNG